MLERGDERSEVVAVGLEAAGAQQAGNVELGVLRQCIGDRGRRRVLDHVGVGPRPRLRQVGELLAGHGGGLDDELGKGPVARHHDRHARLRRHDHQHQPWAQAVVRTTLCGREHPREVRRIELDGRERVGRHVAGVAGRLGAHDVAGVDTDHVAWPVDAQVDVDGVVRRELQVDRQARPAGDGGAEWVGVGDAIGEAPTHEGQEAVAHWCTASSAASTTKVMPELTWESCSASV